MKYGRRFRACAHLKRPKPARPNSEANVPGELTAVLTSLRALWY